MTGPEFFDTSDGKAVNASPWTLERAVAPVRRSQPRLAADARSRARHRQSQDRREQILREATCVIGERGYYGFTIQDLAQRCRLSNPGLLHYFASKEELLLAVLDDSERQAAAFVADQVGVGRLDRAEALPQLTLQQTVTLLRALMIRSSGHPETVRLQSRLQMEALDASHPAHARIKLRNRVTLEAFAASLARHVPDPGSTALEVAAAMQGLEQVWLASEQRFDLVAAWDRIARKLLPEA